MSELHIGRSWSGTHLEDECPCLKAVCGLVMRPNESCDQHGWPATRTMRQIHTARDCEAILAHRERMART